ncbi:hypothetical protein [Thermoactinomyces mirandus]|nr:hypothetical protein [Thermoactinomyces mirandus]
MFVLSRQLVMETLADAPVSKANGKYLQKSRSVNPACFSVIN